MSIVGTLITGSRYPSSIVLRGSLDATLAANLPAMPAIGDVYDISVAGSFENDASILPASAYFSVPDQIRWNGTNWVKMEAGDNISDAAFDNSWDGNVNNAPSKNAVYDEMILKAPITSILEWIAAPASPATATSKQGYLIDTTSAAYTLTLPATPSVGDIVGVSDFAGNSSVNNSTIGRNSELIDGDAADLVVDIDKSSFMLVYTGATVGWTYLGLTKTI